MSGVAGIPGQSTVSSREGREEKELTPNTGIGRSASLSSVSIIFLYWVWEDHTRQCEINTIKFSQMRTKSIALDWYWVTMFFLAKINPNIHCSPGMLYVQVITKNLLYKSVKAYWKKTFFVWFMLQFFIDNLCSYLYFSQKTNYLSILYMHFLLCLHFSYAILQII